MASSGIEPATFLLVAHAVRRFKFYCFGLHGIWGNVFSWNKKISSLGYRFELPDQVGVKGYRLHLYSGLF